MGGKSIPSSLDSFNQKASYSKAECKVDRLSSVPGSVTQKVLVVDFCFPCVLLGHTTASSTSKLNRLMKSPVSDWPCAFRLCQDHETKSVVHKIAMLTMKTCCKTLDNLAKPINLLHNELLNKKVSTNRSKLLSVEKICCFVVGKIFLYKDADMMQLIMAPMIVELFKHCFFEKFLHNKRGNNIFLNIS